MCNLTAIFGKEATVNIEFASLDGYQLYQNVFWSCDSNSVLKTLKILE